MKKTSSIRPTLALAAALTGLMVGCGGNDDVWVEQPVAGEVPASATASPTAYSEFAGSLAQSETTEPLSVDKVVAPVSETEAPIPVS